MKQLTKWHLGVDQALWRVDPCDPSNETPPYGNQGQRDGIWFALFRTSSQHYWGVRYFTEGGDRRIKHFRAYYHGEREGYDLGVPMTDVFPWLQGYLARMGDDREPTVLHTLLKSVTDALQDEVNNEQDV